MSFVSRPWMFLIPSVPRFWCETPSLVSILVDIYYRRGTLPVPEFQRSSVTKPPASSKRLGPNVTLVQVGDRVAYADAFRCVHDVRVSNPEDRLTLIPDGVTDGPGSQQPAQGIDRTLPAEGNRSTPSKEIRPVPRCSWWSGSDLHAVARSLGIHVIWNSIDCGESANRSPSGLHSGSQLQHGRLRRTHFELTGGQGVKAVYDSVGKDTFPGLTRGTQTSRHAGSVRQCLGFSGTINPLSWHPERFI